MRAREFIYEADDVKVNKQSVDIKSTDDRASTPADDQKQPQQKPQSKQYTGPERRKRRSPNFRGPERRTLRGPLSPGVKNPDSSGRDRGDYNIPFHDGTVFIVEPQDSASARYWSLYTKWDIATIKDDAAFDAYVSSEGQPWIICLTSQRGPEGKFLMHPDGEARSLVNFRDQKVSFHNTFARYPRLRQYIKNTLPEGPSSIVNFTNDHLEELNNLVHRGIVELAKNSVSALQQKEYENYMHQLASKHNMLGRDDVPDVFTMYNDKNLRREIMTNPLGKFWWVIDNLARYSVNDLRLAAKDYIINRNYKWVGIREIDEIYSYLIQKNLGNADHGMAKKVKQLITIHKGTPATAGGADRVELPDNVLGTVGGYTVFIKKTNPIEYQ